MRPVSLSELSNSRRVLAGIVLRSLADQPVITSPPAIPSGAETPKDSRPPLGFPLGTAIILFIVFGISTLFSCFYHWEKIRSHAQRLSSSGTLDQIPNSESSSQADHQQAELEQIPDPSKHLFRSSQELSLPVMMPGDDVPKFVAWPSSIKG